MSVSKSEIALVPSWRAATASALPVTKLIAKDDTRAKLIGAVTYMQPSGADVFPSMETVRAFFKKRHRG